MPTLDEVLMVNDGFLTIVREYDGAWFLIFQNGRAFRLPDQEYADFLLARCEGLKYGVAAYNGQYWGLNKPWILNDHEIQVIERLTGEEGDRVIATLLQQAENKT